MKKKERKKKKNFVLDVPDMENNKIKRGHKFGRVGNASVFKDKTKYNRKNKEEKE